MVEANAGSMARDIEEERVFIATQWQLMWWRFRRHRAALIATGVIAALYMVSVLAGFLAMSDPSEGEVTHAYMPPQMIHWFDGGFKPHVQGVITGRDPFTLKKIHTPDPEIIVPIGFWVSGFEYEFLGLFKTKRHFIGISSEFQEDRPAPFFFGSDKLGRDILSRMIYGTRLSMMIGLIGVAVSLFLGISLGGISGFYGGIADTLIQRLIEILRSIPTIPLWIALAAAVPRDWSPIRIFFSITIIISLISWTELGRVVRGRFLALREEEFVTAARLSGATDIRIIFRHMVPSFTSHVIAAASLSIPAMIIAETALSFLGLGLRPPAISWGVLLKDAQNIQSVAVYPWIMFPAVPVVIAVLGFNFMGDGLRDAADPYG
jgi:peptide/nickel transport system permease protein